MPEALTIEDRGRVREFILARPDMLNAFDDLLHDEFTGALEDIRRTPEIRAVVVASTGKVFSAGGDFALMRKGHDEPEYRAATVDRGRRLMSALIDTAQPVVVGIQGAAMGLGATVALSGDALVASRNVKIADTHVNVGLVAGDGGALMWPQTVGMLRARRHLLTGEPLPAELAFGLGMVTDLVDGPDDVLPRARAIADQIAALPPLAVQGTKRTLNRLTRQRHGEAYDIGAAYEEQTMASDDLLEAIAAFREKRAGDYQGR